MSATATDTIQIRAIRRRLVRTSVTVYHDSRKYRVGSRSVADATVKRGRLVPRTVCGEGTFALDEHEARLFGRAIARAMKDGIESGRFRYRGELYRFSVF